MISKKILHPNIAAISKSLVSVDKHNLHLKVCKIHPLETKVEHNIRIVKNLMNKKKIIYNRLLERITLLS